MDKQQRARRRFLGGSGAAAGMALTGALPFGQLLAGAGNAKAVIDGYGPLIPVRDDTTGLPLLKLPKGFRYLSMGWTDDPMSDGKPAPGAHDGMGIVKVEGSRITLVRNHEVSRLGPAFGSAGMQYDPKAQGGTVTLVFDSEQEKLLEARPSLAGTMQNCAGGVTPWGSWLSCEEFVSQAGEVVLTKSGPGRLERDHGFAFEVPAEGHSDAKPLIDMGQFRHEGAVVFAASGDVYLTEDMEPNAGFYRFVPNTPGRLADGGRLFMLRAKGRQDLRADLAVDQPIDVDWVPIEHPALGIDPKEKDIRGVQRQGLVQGAAKFTRLEGIFAGDDLVYFTATNGGNAAAGQVFAYSPAEQQLTLIFETGAAAADEYPDNLCLSPRGGLLLCQDGKGDFQRLLGLARAGANGPYGSFEFAHNNVVLDGAPKGLSGDFRSAEWAGSCFSPDGKWLFANVYRPGFTVAITGPWGEGLI